MTPESYSAIIRERFDREPTRWSKRDEWAYQQARQRLHSEPCECMACSRGMPERKTPAPAWPGTGPLRQATETFTPSQKTKRINSPGAGRPGLLPEVRKKHRNDAQNAKRLAARLANPPTCKDCGKPTGRRMGALRCPECDAANKTVQREQSRLRCSLKESGVIA